MLGRINRVTQKSNFRCLFFCEGVVRRWHKLPGEVAESLVLEVFESHGDVALRAMADGHGEMGWTYCRSLFQP